MHQCLQAARGNGWCAVSTGGVLLGGHSPQVLYPPSCSAGRCAESYPEPSQIYIDHSGSSSFAATRRGAGEPVSSKHAELPLQSSRLPSFYTKIAHIHGHVHTYSSISVHLLMLLELAACAVYSTSRLIIAECDARDMNGPTTVQPWC